MSAVMVCFSKLGSARDVGSVWSVRVALLCLLACGGCDWSGTPRPKPSPKNDEREEARCRELRSSIVDAFRIESLGIRSDVQAGVAIMRQWQRTCASRLKSAEPVASLLPKGTRDRAFEHEYVLALDRADFDDRDGLHIRDCVLLQTLHRQLVHRDGQSIDDRTLVRNVFDFVVRQIALTTTFRENTLYEMYLSGTGTAFDRAVFFSGLLRQSRIDSFVIFPKLDKPANDPAWQTDFLVGVLLGDDVLLFDPYLGIGLPGEAAAKQDQTKKDALQATGVGPAVATWSELVADPKRLERFGGAADRPYRLTWETLRQPIVALIGNRSLWSPRMQQLQTVWSGADEVAIAQALVSSSDHSGVWQRVVSAGGPSWNEKSVGILPYADHMLDQVAARTDPTLDDLWNTPIEPEQTPNGVVPKYTKLLMRARLQQVAGKFDDAIVTYTEVRERCRLPKQANIPLVFRTLHERAIEHASYWSALCQFERGDELDVASAATNFANYLARYEKPDPNGSFAPAWVNAARYHLALCKLRLGDQTAAVKLLEQFPTAHPEWAGHQLRTRQWLNAEKAQPTSPATPSTAPTSASRAEPRPQPVEPPQRD